MKQVFIGSIFVECVIWKSDVISPASPEAHYVRSEIAFYVVEISGFLLFLVINFSCDVSCTSFLFSFSGMLSQCRRCALPFFILFLFFLSVL